LLLLEAWLLQCTTAGRRTRCYCTGDPVQLLLLRFTRFLNMCCMFHYLKVHICRQRLVK
jgi:hypothetical protein